MQYPIDVADLQHLIAAEHLGVVPMPCRDTHFAVRVALDGQHRVFGYKIGT